MSGEVLRVIKAEFGSRKEGSNGASGASALSQRQAKEPATQGGEKDYPSFGIKSKAPLTQDLFEYNGRKLTKSEAREATYNDVHRHEQAHLSKAGRFATSGIHIDYDENGMATSGHVNIAMPSLNPKNLQETIDHANTVIASAEAPAGFDKLSDADKYVATTARGVLAQAIAMKGKQGKQGLGENLDYKA